MSDLLHRRGLVPEREVLWTVSTLAAWPSIDLDDKPPDPRILDRLPPELTLSQALCPWRQVGRDIAIAVADPEVYARHETTLRRVFGSIRPVLAPRDAIRTAITKSRRLRLIARAEKRTATEQSCRRALLPLPGGARLPVAFGLGVVAILAPQALFLSLIGLSCVTLMLFTALRLHAILCALWPRPSEDGATLSADRPVITLLIPLFKEGGVVPHLIRNLRALTYPREKLDVILITEASDTETREAISASNPPPWMRQLTVPEGAVQTKPRAMNYALDHAEGEIVGIYDAEDAPEPDQLLKVARRFSFAPAEVVSLQARLDYFNPHTSWVARCFTLEYATWFSLVLPALARFGWPIPLGGTSVFMRKSALEELGAWDAHNVTEDADLGLRLTRAGYRTELINSWTMEEANHRPLPWVRQRSRWLKGYAMTWAVHAVPHGRLVRDLGVWGTVGVHTIFLGTVLQFTLMPVLWMAALGVPGPWAPFQPGGTFGYVFVLLLFAEAVGLLATYTAMRKRKAQRLRRWIPLMIPYFWLGTFAVYKALYEWLVRPFYWDKTDHGIVQQPEQSPVMGYSAASSLRRVTKATDR
ncbi:MAG: glycosyltransferase [Shimia sp.]